MSELRCVQRHQAVIVDRGGGRKVAQLGDVGRVAYGRALSGKSQATVEILGEACRRQAEVLARINPRRHELVLYRDNLRVWEGPITEVKLLPDRTSVEASDVIEYLDGTPLTQWWPSQEDGGPALAGDRIEEIITHELTIPYTMPVGWPPGNVTFKRWEQLAPPANVLPHLDVRPGALETTADTLAFEMSVGEHLSNLAQGGLRYTALGRKLIVWDQALSIGETRALSENDLGERLNLYVTSRGFTVVQHVIGQSSGDPFDLSNVGSAGATDEGYYGAWTLIDTLQEENEDGDPEEGLAQQAKRLYDERKLMRLDIATHGSGSIRLSDTLTLQMLVPGVIVPVKANYRGRQASSRYLLQGVSVDEAADGEKVGITLATEAEGS